jgi:hypothetical protein
VGLALVTREWLAIAVDSIFIAATALFGWHCIPSRIELDRRGVTWRRRLVTHRIEWPEVAGLSSGLEDEELGGWVTITFTHTAAGKRGRPQLSIQCVSSVAQGELLERMTALWTAAGGSGETSTLGQELHRTTEELAKMTRVLGQVLAGQPTEPLAPRAQVTVSTSFDARGQMSASLTTSDDDPIAITAALWAAGLEQARTQRFNPAFSGALELVVTTAPTPVLDADLDKLVRELRDELERVGLRTASGGSIVPTWRYAAR